MEYTKRQFTRLGDFGLSEEYRTAEAVGSTLAYLDHYNGAKSTAVVFDPATGRSRAYSMRDRVKAKAIVARHLERLGYKNRIDLPA